MPPLARRNLFHDRIRLIVTLTGIAFSVVLMVIQWGLFRGFSTSTTNIIDHSAADIWVAARNTAYIEQAIPFNERKYYQILATPGVAVAARYIERWATWKEPNGHSEAIAVVGCDPDSSLGVPWNLVAGDPQLLKVPNGVIVDRIYAEKLGAQTLDDRAEINGFRARVVGFTRGIHSFTSPYVFTTFKNALDYAGLQNDQLNFVLVKAKPGIDIDKLKADLQARLPDNDVYTTGEFSAMTRHYWMFTTGAGVAVLMAAVLGLIVGIAIVAQTIYATTMDHIREYGTLKAMGAPNRYVLGVIMTQAAIAALLGYVIGMMASIFVVRGAETGGAYILLGWQTAVGLLLLTLAMCTSAAILSVNKILSLDPAMVFKA